MPAPALHLPGLHYLLWAEADPDTRLVRITQKQLADDLCVSPYTMNRAMVALEREGRVAVVTEGSGRSKLYQVIDPLLVDQ